MLDNEYFSNTDKMYYKNKDYIYLYTDADTKDKSKEILINDNSISKYMTLNRNLTVLRNKLHKKLDRSKVFTEANIEYGPQGFVLVSGGNGVEPYWETPEKVMSMLKTNETIDKEYFLLDYTTMNNSLFTNLSNVSITTDIKFTADGSLYLLPFEITKTGEYQIYMEIVPKKLDLLKTQAGIIYVRDTGLSADDTFICVSDRGDIVLDDVSLVSDSTGTKIYSDTTFSSVSAVYSFNLKLNFDIFTDSRNFKIQQIDDIMIAGDKLYIDFAPKECSGDTMEFYITGKSGLTIEKIKVTLDVTEVS